MRFTCQRCGNPQLGVSTFVDYSANTNNSWHWLFRCSICGYIGEDAELVVGKDNELEKCKEQMVKHE